MKPFVISSDFFSFFFIVNQFSVSLLAKNSSQIRIRRNEDAQIHSTNTPTSGLYLRKNSSVKINEFPLTIDFVFCFQDMSLRNQIISEQFNFNSLFRLAFNSINNYENIDCMSTLSIFSKTIVFIKNFN